MENKKQEQQLHENAKAYHNKKVSDDYVKGRPTYPIESIEQLKSNEIGLTVDSIIVDLAAGTGKFTEMLINSGFKNVNAIEPSPEFREKLNKIIESKNNGNDGNSFKVLDGLATKLPFENDSIDCICSAQAFHWFANIESIKEISRVLKPNGVFFLLWNHIDEELTPEISQAMKLFKFYQNDSPKFEDQKWRLIFDEIKSNHQSSLLNPNLINNSFINPQITNSEKTIAAILSISYISLLPIDKKEKLVNDIKNSFESFEKTKENKDFILNYKTQTFYTRKPINQ
ncbi:hypothetical protein ACTFIY_006300 [Dictyostelium cf. discoideum]